MQLGELQGQLDRFTGRSASVVALSVDPPAHSRNMIRRMSLAFPVVSDEKQAVMQAYGVVNPDTEELALHAVYIVDQDRRIFYRKVARRRPLSRELLDAIDYYQGNYPVGDSGPAYQGVPVAFPQNNFQALIEIATNSELPETIQPESLGESISLRQRGELDESTIRYRELVTKLAANHGEEELLATAAWFTKQAVGLNEQALSAGRSLNDALVRQRALRQTDANSPELAEIQQELDDLRRTIRDNAGNWRLRSARTTLRGYRELSLAALR